MDGLLVSDSACLDMLVVPLVCEICHCCPTLPGLTTTLGANTKRKTEARHFRGIREIRANIFLLPKVS